jgi:hypothetical protein
VEVWSHQYTETEGDHSLVWDNYTAFITEFNNTFGMHTQEDTARNTFMNMFMKYVPNEPKQYGTFDEYDTAFEELRSQIGDVFGDGGIKYLYLWGLARKIQEPFVHREVDAMTFEEVRKYTTRFDQQNQALCSRNVPEPAKKTSHHPNPHSSSGPSQRHWAPSAPTTSTTVVASTPASTSAPAITVQAGGGPVPMDVDAARAANQRCYGCNCLHGGRAPTLRAHAAELSNYEAAGNEEAPWE